MDQTKIQNIVAIVPSYNPDAHLLEVVEGLRNIGFARIVVVNDGSTPESVVWFERVSAFPEVSLAVHEVNRGKGQALRTAFAYVQEHFSACDGVVTLDGDGQHRSEDVAACAAAIYDAPDSVILGVRDFSLPNVPEKSRKGNHITSWVFKVFCHLKISDTQTGLRAIPTKLLPVMLDITGDRYEYETNMLLRMGNDHIPYVEVPIETVYIEQNQASHFRPVRDSVRIYSLIFGRLIKYGLSSLGCLLVEGTIQTLLHSLWQYTFNVSNAFLSLFLKELCDFLPARILSSILNYWINKKFVFDSKKQKKGSLVRYYALWSVQAVVTALATTGIVSLVGGATGILYFLLTTLVKTVIFFASYLIQKKWVFAEKQ